MSFYSTLSNPFCSNPAQSYHIVGLCTVLHSEKFVILVMVMNVDDLGSNKLSSMCRIRILSQKSQNQLLSMQKLHFKVDIFACFESDIKYPNIN